MERILTGGYSDKEERKCLVQAAKALEEFGKATQLYVQCRHLRLGEKGGQANC